MGSKPWMVLNYVCKPVSCTQGLMVTLIEIEKNVTKRKHNQKK